jgi:hypothetical protein
MPNGNLTVITPQKVMTGRPLLHDMGIEPPRFARGCHMGSQGSASHTTVPGTASQTDQSDICDQQRRTSKETTWDLDPCPVCWAGTEAQWHPRQQRLQDKFTKDVDERATDKRTHNLGVKIPPPARGCHVGPGKRFPPSPPQQQNKLNTLPEKGEARKMTRNLGIEPPPTATGCHMRPGKAKADCVPNDIHSI